jgi:hypothetical protein
MTDFVTRLESGLREAAVRRERVWRIRGAALPRLRVAIGELPTAALASVLLGLAVAGVAILLASSPEQPARPGLPAALRGVWRSAPTELRLYPTGSARCTNLGLGSSNACYTIGDTGTGVAQEWGELSVAGHELTMRSAQGGPPGLYRWLVEGRVLRLTKLRDAMAARSRALASGRLTQVRKRHAETEIPIDWTARVFKSERFGYSIRYPSDWSAREAAAAGRPDRLGSEASALPAVAIAVQNVSAATSPARWAVIVNSRSAVECADYSNRRLSADGETIRITTYRNCGGTSQQQASFVHSGRGYSVLWRGKPGRDQTDLDGPLFDAILNTVVFSP